MIRVCNSVDGVKLLGGLNNVQITKEEIKGAVKEMKAGKIAGLNGCAVKCLKSSSTSVIDCFVK